MSSLGDWLSSLSARLAALTRRKELDEDLADELAHHLEMKQREEGGNPVAARHAFGGETQWHEATREAWTFGSIEALWTDTRQAAARLSKSRGFSLTAILTLALGIGVTTAIFSLLNALLWQPLPVREPGQLARVVVTHLPPTERQWFQGRAVPAAERANISFPMYEALQRRLLSSGVVEGMFGVGGTGAMHVERNGVPQRARVATVTGSFFTVAGAGSQVGRVLNDSDDQAGRPGPGGWPVVISDHWWSAEFARSPAAVGAVIAIERVSFVVVGVAAAGFHGIAPGQADDLWIPMSATESMFPSFRWRNSPSLFALRPWARLSPGRSLDDAARVLKQVAPGVMEETVDPAAAGEARKHQLAMQLEPRPGATGSSDLARSYRDPLFILLAAVGAVLLIAATNVTSLFLARSTARRHELAIRLSLGAPAWRIRRDILIEASLLAGAGTIAGVVLSRWARSALVALANPGVGSAGSIDAPLDWRMLGFLAAVLAAVTFVAGLAPAIAAGQTSLRAWEQPRGSSAAPRAFWLRNGLVVLQTALALALAGFAGVMTGSLRELLNDATGLDASRSVFLTPDLYNAGVSREAMGRAYENILADVRAHSEVAAASWTMTVPLSRSMSLFTVEVPGRSGLNRRQRELLWHQVGDGYFAAAGIPIVAGRDLPPRESGRRNIGVVSESVARRFFGSSEQALGQRIRPGSLPWTEIVGVAADAKYFNVREPSPATLYLPYWNDNDGASPGMTLVLRHHGTGASAATAAAMRAFQREAGGRVPHVEKRTITDNVAANLGAERLIATLLTAFAVLALTIAATGIAGLLSYLVEQRRGDFGIRMALGATARRIGLHVAGHAFALVSGGLIAGGLVSYALRRSLDAYAYGVTASNPRVWIVSGCVLLAATGVAAAVPAWRASRIDPARLLRAS